MLGKFFLKQEDSFAVFGSFIIRCHPLKIKVIIIRRSLDIAIFFGRSDRKLFLYLLRQT